MRVLSLAAVISMALPLLALDPGKTLTQEVHRIWGQEEGLVQPTVYSIAQTRNGFLWLGTQDSLIRFDGLHFREYVHAAEAGIQRSLIRNLLEDEAGNLWVATIGNGLVRIAPDGSFKTFTHTDGVDSQNAFCVARGSQGSVFVCTDKGLLHFENDRFTQVGGLPSGNVRAMCQSPNGTRWVAGIDFGLYSSSGGGFNPVGTNQEIDVLSCPADNTVWLGTPNGLLHIEGRNVRHFTTADGLPDNSVSALHQSPDGTLWIGTADGVTRYRDGRLAVYRVRDGLSHSLVLSIQTDREGTLWVGTKNGLDQFTDGKVTPYTTNEGMLSNTAGPVVEDSSGRLWVGTNRGLNVFNGSIFSALGTRNVLSLFPEANGDLWVGTDRGIDRLHDGRVVASYKLDPVSAIFRDLEGVLWAGTETGLRYLDGNIFKNSNLGLPADNRPVLALSSTHTVRLFASAAGPSLSYLKDNVAHVENLQTSQPVDCFYFDHATHTGWLGTLGSGLLHWKNGAFTHVRIKDGLYDNRIYAILPDDQKNLWFASSKGIFSVSERELLDFVAGKSRYVTSIPFSTGQLRFECRSGVQPAACRTHDGRLWFSTTNGLVVVDPNKLKNNLAPPPVQITANVINGRRTEPAQNITLNPFERNLEIRYAALSFISPEKITFRYMLSGYDKNWIDAGTRREAFYANLPPGHFKFMVMARNADGVWSKDSATLNFAVAPRIYERKWFFPALVLLAASAGVVWYRLRIRRLKQSFKLILTERSRIARELHDTLLQGLSGVTMQLQALWVRLAPSREKDFLQEIIQDAARSSAEARQSLWGLRTSTVSPLEFTEKLAKTCHEANAGDRLDLILQLDPVSLASMPDAEFQLLRIAREAVSNAVRHSGASSMTIGLKASKSELHLSLADDGTGFDSNVAQAGHFGLIGMRERASEIGAHFDLTTQPGRGVKIDVRLPQKVQQHQLQ